MERTFKDGEDITVIAESNFLIGKPGVVVKTLEHPPKDEEGTIVVDFPEVPVYMFNNNANILIPEKQKKWCVFKPESLVLGRKPLTHEEQIERELQNFGSMAPLRYYDLPPRKDGLCMADDCQNFASGILWFNTWGTGYRLHVCRWHQEDHRPYTCCDELPFKVKPEEKEVLEEEPISG